MDEASICNYNEHAKLLAEIGFGILKGNSDLLKCNYGIKELISFYLLIPYLTTDQLITPNLKCKIPKIEGYLAKTDKGKYISLKSLRDGMCHSFVSIEKRNEDGKFYLVFDDRIGYENRKEHESLEDKDCYLRIKVEDAHRLLLHLYNEVLKQ